MQSKNEMEKRIMAIMARRSIFSSLPFTKPIISLDIGTDKTDIETAKITYVSIVTPDRDYVLTNRSEKVTLIETAKLLKNYSSGTILGFNLIEFDILLLHNKFSEYKINIPKIFDNLLDLRRILSSGKPFAKGTLDQYAAVFDLREWKYGWSKSHYYLLWQDPTIESLKQFLLWDAKTTLRIFSHLMSGPNEETNCLQELQQPITCQSR